MILPKLFHSCNDMAISSKMTEIYSPKSNEISSAISKFCIFSS